ncbi:MAG: hypothetical protein WKF61_02930 [Luteimonas sp.]
MFGFSSDYSRGQQEQQFRETLGRRQQQRQGNSAVAQWQSYARELEGRLAQAEAETKAARVQRNVIDKRLGEMIDALREVSPNHRLSDEVSRGAENRAEVDATLAREGIKIERSGTGATVVRTR